MDKIDFIITWVDGNDAKWQEQKLHYSTSGNICDKSDNRYRDWGFLKYWFRSIEQCAPWVNKIHFVTCGQKPEWLNEKNPKLHIVNHCDFMPSNILPTFNSVPIELYLHKIPGVSENFVYFNDDMFINKKVNSNVFFRNGRPCDSAVLSAITPSEGADRFSHCLLADAELLDNDYNIHVQIRKNLSKWFTPRYLGEQIRTLLLLPWHNLPGIKMHHMPISYCKATYENVWKKHEEELLSASEDKFRNNDKINHWVFRYEQLIAGCFFPRNPKIARLYNVNNMATAQETAKDIRKSRHSLICINDSIQSPNEFKRCKEKIISEFEKKYPDKSSFEK